MYFGSGSEWLRILRPSKSESDTPIRLSLTAFAFKRAIWSKTNTGINNGLKCRRYFLYCSNIYNLSHRISTARMEMADSRLVFSLIEPN